MSDLLTAAGKLRDSREKLPEYARVDQVIRTQPARWTHDDTGNVFAVRHHGEVDRGPAAIGAGGILAEAETDSIAAYMAMFSPHVTEALEDHLEALAVFREPIIGEPITWGNTGDAIRRLLSTGRALAAAINHTGKD